MNLIDKLKFAFGWTPPAPTLRNKPGGLAWVSSGGDTTDAQELRGSVVTTVRLLASGHWLIEPKLRYQITRETHFVRQGLTGQPGYVAVVDGLDDCCLTPIPDAGISDSEVRELFAPKLPEVA